MPKGNSEWPLIDQYMRGGIEFANFNFGLERREVETSEMEPGDGVLALPNQHFLDETTANQRKWEMLTLGISDERSIGTFATELADTTDFESAGLNLKMLMELARCAVNDIEESGVLVLLRKAAEARDPSQVNPNSKLHRTTPRMEEAEGTDEFTPSGLVIAITYEQVGKLVQASFIKEAVGDDVGLMLSDYDKVDL